jgi:outer membrane protein OmpA-like peptidoglycan-associated protein
LNEYSRTILFDSGKSSFKKQTYPTLVSYWNLKRISLFKILSEGHTDSDGSTMNQDLSMNRAQRLKIFDWKRY